MSSKIVSANRYDMVYERIKDDIINNVLKPSQKINILELSERFGVSTSPINTAIRALERDGYITILPQRGTYIRELSAEELEQLFILRMQIEIALLDFVVNKINAKVLNKFRKKFLQLMNSKKEYQKVVEEYYETEINLHDYLSSCNPELIRAITQNIVDLTKRTRKLSFLIRVDSEDDVKWLVEDINTHVAIIDALIGKDVETAKKYTTLDIERTKNRIIHISNSDFK